MPNYLGHTTINTIAGGAIGYGLASTNTLGADSLILSGVAFGFATLFLSPDLDLNHSTPSRNWGPMRILWWPYSKMFRHRGLSHSFVFGTFTRASYLALVLCLPFAGIFAFDLIANGATWSEALAGPASKRHEVSSMAATWWKAGLSELYLILGAVFCADSIHVLADKTFSAAKCLLRFRKR